MILHLREIEVAFVFVLHCALLYSQIMVHTVHCSVSNLSITTPINNELYRQNWKMDKSMQAVGLMNEYIVFVNLITIFLGNIYLNCRSITSLISLNTWSCLLDCYNFANIEQSVLLGSKFIYIDCRPCLWNPWTQYMLE